MAAVASRRRLDYDHCHRPPPIALDGLADKFDEETADTSDDHAGAAIQAPFFGHVKSPANVPDPEWPCMGRIANPGWQWLGAVAVTALGYAVLGKLAGFLARPPDVAISV